MSRAYVAPFKAKAATQLDQAAYYRRSLQRGLMARDIAVPAAKECIRVANVMSESARILAQV